MEILEKKIDLPSSSEKGTLGILHLKRYWSKCMAIRQGKLQQDQYREEWIKDRTLLHTMGLGLEQTIKYLYQNAPDFETFEKWILEVNSGNIPSEKIEQYNTAFLNPIIHTGTENTKTVLNDEDMKFWDENGYVIIRNAVSKEDCDATVKLICDFMKIDLNDPSSWYKAHPAKQGIMIQLFQHPVLQKNRESEKIKIAYEQLWNRKDLWVSTDRVSFNPPETITYPFQGPRLHWDVSLDLPIPFGTQGLLYLTDTEENQGAFTLIPGFQNRIESWIHHLPAGANPRTEDLYQLGPKPIAAKAGDFILWHQALPHGSSPNTSPVPRIVQYINYAPLDEKEQAEWK
jgi:ectoine hydroxylase-related dioxygenase (phytanoyl-CoA dioxygenase family)